MDGASRGAPVRQGSFPSGLDASEWLALARRFGALQAREGDVLDDASRSEVLAALDGAMAALQVFVPDEPALKVFLSRTWGRVSQRSQAA